MSLYEIGEHGTLDTTIARLLRDTWNTKRSFASKPARHTRRRLGGAADDRHNR